MFVLCIYNEFLCVSWLVARRTSPHKEGGDVIDCRHSVLVVLTLEALPRFGMARDRVLLTADVYTELPFLKGINGRTQKRSLLNKRNY